MAVRPKSFFLAGIILAYCCPASAQGPDLPINTCNDYLKLAMSSTPIIGVPNSQTFEVSGNPAWKGPGRIPTSGGNGMKMVLPGKSSWLPSCNANGSYVMLQKRVNGDLFCVRPENGEVAFEIKSKPASGEYACACPVQNFQAWRAIVRGAIIPECDEATGLYKPQQWYRDSGSNPNQVCMTSDGTITTKRTERFRFGAGTCTAGGVFVPK
ncbi:hypothetical protein BV898_16149 [Hypsibius exemplaris]|uniref:Thyroglobulin type-1 domain-containing protein n=1 Tax=Hypsibius exemplaris TaxID=2072580 RepID=A0A9X6NCM1_HYPEX|nr:hypothetical protein BV898_16149 [Hypsibius exemplaris]